MEYRTHAHRHADLIFTGIDGISLEWTEIRDALAAISDEDIIREFESNPREAKSISQAINRLIKQQLCKRGWLREVYIFADEAYARQARGVWRLDFAADYLCVEVAFNHRSDIAWNLLKPTLSSELNHVRKAVRTDGGVIITATQALKDAGGFDNAVGTFDDYVQYLKPLSTILAAPLMIVGLEAPRSFHIEVESRDYRRVGHVVRH